MTAFAALAAAIILSAPVVIDGDTLRDGAAIYRLENIDAPESLRGAKCPAEAALADQATREAWRMVLGAHKVEAYPTGRIDKYNRVIARVRIDGADLGEALIARGLAAKWRGRHKDWCTKVSE